jgi:arylsulfatase A-like enzyme
VCSPCRSALITGCHQTTIGAHHHRSGRGTEKIHLPAGVTPIPALLRRAGYFTCIGTGLPPAPGAPPGARERPRLGKTDYNFEWDAAMYDGDDWAARAPGQPFFMQVQLPGGKLRGNSDESARRLSDRAARELGSATAPESVRLPPYYPRDPVLLRDWAAYLDSVRITDNHVGRVLARLEAAGLLGETLVVFMTDHGISHARGKQFLYDEGTHIPFIARGPGVPAGAVRDDLVEHIDLAAVTLAAAGLPLPPAMQAKDILAADYRPRDAVFAARDRCDETVDHLRSVRTRQFLYIRNGHPARPHLQPNAYKDGKSIVQTLRALHAAGTLEPLSDRLLFSPTRPPEELYAWNTDRWQIVNLANDPAHQDTLASHRQLLDQWLADSRDPGAESESRYDSDMAVYLEEAPAIADLLRHNIALMKQWAREGK